MFFITAFEYFLAATIRNGHMWSAAAAMAMLTTTSTRSVADQPDPCSPRADVLSRLARSFGELPRDIGLTDAGNLIEVLSTKDGSTWSIIVTTPEGISCLVGAGEFWQELRESAANDDKVRQ